MTGLRYSPLHMTELCGEMQGKFIVGRTRLKMSRALETYHVGGIHVLARALKISSVDTHTN